MSVAAVHEALVAWARGVLGDLPVAAALDDRPATTATVVLQLLQLEPSPPARGAGVAPLRLGVRHLVAVDGPDPVAAGELLGELALAALAGVAPEVEVDLAPLAPAAWLALGVPSRPSFSVRTHVVRHRAVAGARVLHPLVVQASPIPAHRPERRGG